MAAEAVWIIGVNALHPAERIARDTWGRLKLSRELQTRLGEETLTDLLVLDFVRLMDCRAKLFQSTKIQESKRGTDLEIRIHAGGNRAIAFALQAKKLNRDERYVGFKAKVNSHKPLQREVLENYAETVCAVPLYLLYNYVCRDELGSFWNCLGCPDEEVEQLGCTVVPSRIIRRAGCKRGRSNFDWIHKSKVALPWRCLFDCPHHCTLRYDSEYNRPVDGGWPDWLWSQDGTTFSDDDVERLRDEISREAMRKRQTEGSKFEREHEPDVPTRERPRHLILVKEKAR